MSNLLFKSFDIFLEIKNVNNLGNDLNIGGGWSSKEICLVRVVRDYAEICMQIGVEVSWNRFFFTIYRRNFT